jgi:hypothetical protein
MTETLAFEDALGEAFDDAIAAAECARMLVRIPSLVIACDD